MSDHPYIAFSLVHIERSEGSHKSGTPTAAKKWDRDPGREVPHFVRDDRQLKTAQRTVNEHI
jgi:hypothetical protein